MAYYYFSLLLIAISCQHMVVCSPVGDKVSEEVPVYVETLPDHVDMTENQGSDLQAVQSGAAINPPKYRSNLGAGTNGKRIGKASRRTKKNSRRTKTKRRRSRRSRRGRKTKRRFSRKSERRKRRRRHRRRSWRRRCKTIRSHSKCSTSTENCSMPVKRCSLTTNMTTAIDDHATSMERMGMNNSHSNYSEMTSIGYERAGKLLKLNGGSSTPKKLSEKTSSSSLKMKRRAKKANNRVKTTKNESETSICLFKPDWTPHGNCSLEHQHIEDER